MPTKRVYDPATGESESFESVDARKKQQQLDRANITIEKSKPTTSEKVDKAVDKALGWGERLSRIYKNFRGN